MFEQVTATTGFGNVRPLTVFGIDQALNFPYIAVGPGLWTLEPMDPDVVITWTGPKNSLMNTKYVEES